MILIACLSSEILKPRLQRQRVTSCEIWRLPASARCTYVHLKLNAFDQTWPLVSISSKIFWQVFFWSHDNTELAVICEYTVDSGLQPGNTSNFREYSIDNTCQPTFIKIHPSYNQAPTRAEYFAAALSNSSLFCSISVKNTWFGAALFRVLMIEEKVSLLCHIHDPAIFTNTWESQSKVQCRPT